MTHKFKTIKLGTTCSDVVALQLVLRMLQYTGMNNKPLDISGYCGEDTVKAINEFQTKQRAYGYECGSNGSNDGVFGSKCWSALLGYEESK